MNTERQHQRRLQAMGLPRIHCPVCWKWTAHHMHRMGNMMVYTCSVCKHEQSYLADCQKYYLEEED